MGRKKAETEVGSLDRDTFIREISIHADITIAEAKVVVDALQEVFEKAIVAHAPLDIRGLGHLTFTVIPAHRGYSPKRYMAARKQNPNAQKEDYFEDYPETIRANFKLSKNLTNLLRKPKVDE